MRFKRVNISSLNYRVPILGSQDNFRKSRVKRNTFLPIPFLPLRFSDF